MIVIIDVINNTYDQRMIEIIDVINNTIKEIKDLEIVIHPLTNQTHFLEDFQKSGKYIYRVIFDKQGILFCYRKI